MKRQPWYRSVALLAAATLAASACGGGGDTEESDGGDGEDGADTEATAGEPEPTTGFDGETITLGALTPTSGDVAVIGEPLTAGNQAYIDYVNEELGGVAGEYQLEMTVQDTGYDPTVASQQYPDMRENVAMFVQILGTPIVDALLADLQDDDMVASPATLDSKWVREPNLLPIGAPYQYQAINGIDWYMNEGGGEGQTLCALASEDEYGDAGLEGVEFAAESLDIEVAETARFPAPSAERPEQNFVSQISQLEGADCDSVFFIATATDTSSFATALSENPGYDPTVLATSPTWLGLWAENQYIQDNFYFILEGPQYGDESVEGMSELMRIQEEYSEAEPDIYFNFGFNQARATVQVLEKAVELGDLSREGIMTAMQEIDTLSFDDLQGEYQYGPAEDRQPPTANSVFQANPELAGADGTGLELVTQGYEAEYIDEFSID